MSWISPTFGDRDETPALLPPKKRAKKADSTGSQPSFEIVPTQGALSWLQKYKPKGVGDLAPHVKKVADVEAWLTRALRTNGSKFLLLSGPTGCGKTTTLLTLCRSLGAKVMEWITPLDKMTEEDSGYQNFEYPKSAVKKFEEFLLRSSRYNSCLVVGSPTKIVLVKDFPNAFLYNPSVFHELLGSFVRKCVYPVVFICSDDALCRKLFPNKLKDECRIETIAFNPVPDQRMFKVLKSLLIQESKSNKSFKILADDTVNAISACCNGDLRSAITTLYFHSVDSRFSLTQIKPQSKLKKASEADETAPNKDNRLDFFRGIGRVLFPKRIETKGCLKFVHSTDDIIGHFLSEPSGFLSQLNENYPSKMGNIYDLSDAAERMSKSDLLICRWQDKDIFRTYALSVAVKGLMACNRHPQKGRYEPFRRSTTSRVEIDGKALELEGKAMFSQLNILDYTSLIDILPFARTLVPEMNPSQLNYVQRTCRFKSF